MKALRCIVLGLGCLAVVLTGVALLPSNDAFVRIWDFPRVQLAAVLAVALLASPWLLKSRNARSAAGAAFGAALVWHLAAIWPYTSLHDKQVGDAESCSKDARLTLLVANVLMDNQDAAPLLALVERRAPDVIFLAETDASWDRKLAPLARAFPHVLRQPQNNTYGLHLFSRLPLRAPSVRFLVEKDVPSVKAGVRLPSGARLDLYGLHPRPPPLQDTAERDAEIVMIGREVAKSGVPAVVFGDLNDVAWSATTRLFQKVSGLIDPRVGRGTFDTFHARWPFLKWPLDHVFLDSSFTLIDMAVEQGIGSDHFPVYIALCFDPKAARGQEAPRPDAEDLAEADEAVKEGHAEEAEDKAGID